MSRLQAHTYPSDELVGQAGAGHAQVSSLSFAQGLDFALCVKDSPATLPLCSSLAAPSQRDGNCRYSQHHNVF